MLQHRTDIIDSNHRIRTIPAYGAGQFPTESVGTYWLLDRFHERVSVGHSKAEHVTD